MTYIQSTGGAAVASRNYLAALSFIGGIETPSTLPELTHTWGDTHFSANPADLEAWIDAIEAAILGTTNSWRVLDELNQGGGIQRSLLIGGPLGSPVANVRVLFSIGTTPPTNRCPNTHAGNNYGYVGMAPDAGASGYDAFVANGGTVGDPWDGGGANPFGVARFTGHAAFFTDITAANTGFEQVCVADSLETLFLAASRYPSGNAVTAVYLGATIIPPHDDAAEADGRVYGLHASGPNGLSTAMNGNTNRFPGFNTGTLDASGFIFDPTSPSTLVSVKRFTMYGGLPVSHSTKAGPQFGGSIYMQDQTGGEGRGWMRQMISTNDSNLGMSTPDVNGVPVAFGASNDLRYYYDGVALVNLPQVSPTDLFGLPKLAFSLGSAQNLVVTTDMEDWIDAIDAAVTATTNSWRVLDRLTQAGGAQIALLIGGPLGSPVANSRAIVTASSASTPLGLFFQTFSDTDYGYVGYSPDAGAYGAYDTFGAGAGQVKDPWTSATPFDTTARWSGFAALVRDLGVTGNGYVRAIDSAETLFVATSLSATSRIRAFYLGATMAPLTSASADPDGRLHGLHVTSPSEMRSVFNTYQYFPAHSAGTLESCACVFGIAGLEYPTYKWYPSTLNAVSSETPDGLKFVQGVTFGSANGGIGWMRQFGYYSDVAGFTAITDKDAVTVGYALSRHAGVAADAYALLNFTNTP